MKTLKEQTDAKIEQSRQAKPDFMKTVEELIAKAKEFNEGGHCIQVGESAPSFKLPDQTNKSISLRKLLQSGPIVLIFYRGSWCPYCNLQLKAIQSRIDEIHTLGAQLVAISPEVPDNSLTPSEISKMNFIVLSDQDAKTAKNFGVAWEVPKFLLEHMRKDRQLDLEVINNGNSTILPIPATYIINKKGEVIWSYVNVDYRTRSEPQEIINVLKGLAK